MAKATKPNTTNSAAPDEADPDAERRDFLADPNPRRKTQWFRPLNIVAPDFLTSGAELCAEGRVILSLLDDWRAAGILSHVKDGGPAHQAIEAFRAALGKAQASPAKAVETPQGIANGASAVD